MTRFYPLAIAALFLTGCDGATGPTTTTKLDAVEVEPGTVSDAMIMLDDSDVDGTAVDNSGGALTAEGAAAAKVEAERAAAAAPPPEDVAAADTETEEATKSQ